MISPSAPDKAGSTIRSASRLRATFDSEQFRRYGHRLIDRIAGYLAAATGGASMPVLTRMSPDESVATWPGNFPEVANGGLEEQFARLIAGSNHLHHPGYVGHQVPPTLPLAALSSLVADVLNNSLATYEMGPSGAAIERSVVRWMTRALGMGNEADGVLTGGGALATLTALLGARQVKAGYDAWKDGTNGGKRQPLAVLASEQAHYCVARAVQIMGWGERGAVPVPVDSELRMRRGALQDALTRAEEEGLKVIAVVANSCSTATGIYDPLREIAEFCAATKLWLHVDAAHGAAAALSSKYRHLVAGIERADSVVWDAHKMLLMPLNCSAVLFRNGRDSYATFAQQASYLWSEEGQGNAGEWFNLGKRTLECSKPMLGFPLYSMLSSHGTALFAEYVTGVYDLARQFAEQIKATADFALAVEPDSNIVCFRYIPEGVTELDSLQTRVRDKILASGSHYLVHARLPSGLYLRITLMNPFTSIADLNGLLDAIRKAGE